ncbi:MAG: phytanoyl-CoA dioxygenase family protein [Caldilineaceae bacterium]|nr:phytanoyl-CoA dioxygenase family protein [Caldilineaceae bacterium]HRJ41936.1 phytanoyl-CoA dioxygenase family protein [Caldilineaceae bacterium]
MAENGFVHQFQEAGYVVARGLFSAEEVQSYREHFMQMRAAGTYPGDFAGVDLTSSDPLKRYPRMIHMHRWDDLSLGWMLDERLNRWMTGLLGIEPYAVQTMLYFKPAGGRGQALHQDQYYLKVQPGTCIAAWMALDDCDIENGCLQVVPGTQNLPILCTVQADTTQSFTDVTVPIPDGMQAEPVLMKAGDVLFFNGQLIHGSFPNTSQNRFRRSLIGHYIVGEAEQVAKFYHPVLRMDGTPVELGVSEGGSECGVWVEEEGAPAVKMRPLDTPMAMVTE